MMNRIMSRMLLLFTIMFFCVGAAPLAYAQIGSSQVSGGTIPPVVNVPEDYRVDTGDVISVEIVRHPELNRTIRLSADAKLRLPRLLKPVPARGKTCIELSDDITKQMISEGKLVLHPGQVSVSVVEMRYRRVFVRGNAGRSGEYDLKNGWRVTELYAVIGGVTNPERVTAKILNPSRLGPLPVNLVAALANPESGENLPLLEGDTLLLELPKVKRLFVKGEGPRGAHEIDERFGLRQALIQLGVSTNGATGDLRKAVLLRHTVAGDPTSPENRIPVDLFTLMSDDSKPDVSLEDLDTIEIPVSQRYVYIFGEINTGRKYYLREDQSTYLVDIMGLGGTTSAAKIDDVRILRRVNGKPVVKSYKFGKFISNGDLKQNPEILAQDMIFVPNVKRPDYIGSVWQAWGLFGIVQAVLPQARLR